MSGGKRTLGSDPAEVRRSDSEPDFCGVSEKRSFGIFLKSAAPGRYAALLMVAPRTPLPVGGAMGDIRCIAGR